MKLIKCISFLFLVSVTSKHGYALSRSEIEDLSISHSLAFKAQEFETLALKSSVDMSGKWQNPQLMGQFGSLQSSGNSGMTAEVSLTQPVPLSNKYSLRKEIAEYALSLQGKQTEYFKNWVAHQALLAAWKVVITDELFKHGKERTRRFALIHKYISTRPRVSIKQRVELSVIASQLVQLEKELDQKQHDAMMAQNDLEFWTGKKIKSEEIELSIPDHYLKFEKLNVDITKDLEFLNSQNRLQIAKAEREMAQKERRPDLFLGGGYRVENVSPANHFSYGIVGLNIPLWDTGSGKLEMARAREMRDQKMLEESQRQLENKHNNQIELLKLAIHQLERFPKKFIRSSEESIREAEVGFKQGVLDVTTFLQAETQSHEMIDQVHLVWLNYLENLSLLNLMRGESLHWEKN